MNKIIGMMKNNDFFIYLVKNKFVLYFSTTKRMERNEKENLFFMNGKLFLEILRNALFLFILWSPFI